jgi:hypothetical protein
MSIVASVVSLARGSTAAVASAAKRTGFWNRMAARLIEARERQVVALIQRHGAKLPHELEEAGWKINQRSEDSLPFVR